MIDLAEEIIVDGELTLGQFLNYEGIVESGGQAKWFLKEYDVYLNGEHETRRGKNCVMAINLIFQKWVHLLSSLVSNETKNTPA